MHETTSMPIQSATDIKDMIAAAIGGLEKYRHDCHRCSLAIVRCGVLPDEDLRVARGFTRGVPAQHSWVVVGDPYDHTAPIIDGTLWSYTDREPTIDVHPTGDHRNYRPHGAGSIWQYGRPPEPIGQIIDLRVPLSDKAKRFLDLAAPAGLDYDGWRVLANSPVGGWPSKEIFTAMYNDNRLRVLIPIDVVGMATDLNPSGLYW